MSRRKKFIIAVLAATVLLVGSIGVALAQTGSASDGSGKTLLARVAAILVIDQQKLENAFAQAQREMRDEALDQRLQKLVSEGKITKIQADQYKVWSQARPNMEPFTQQLKEWQKARPDMPLPGSFDRHGFQSGMKWGGGHYFRGR